MEIFGHLCCLAKAFEGNTHIHICIHMYTRVKPCRIFPGGLRLSLMESLTIKTVLSLSIYLYLSICLLLIYYLFGVDPALLCFVVHPEDPASDFIHGCPLLCLSPLDKALMSRTQLETQYGRTHPLPSGSLNGSLQLASNKKHRHFC